MTQSLALRITIVGDDAGLKERLACKPLPENIAIYLEDCASLSDKRIRLADVLIICGGRDTIEEIQGLNTEHFRGKEGVLCTDAELADYAAEQLGDLDGFIHGIWTLPASDLLLGFWFRQLLKAAENAKAAQISNIYLDTLIDSIPDLVWFKDLRGSHLKVNEAFCRAVGKTKVQCEGRGHYYIWDLEPEDYAAGEYVCLETEEEVIRQQKTCLFDEKVMSKSGLRQFATYKSPLIDIQGQMFGTVGIAKDVTDLKNISRELEVILSSIPFAALIADPEGSVIYFNDRVCEYFSITREELEGMQYSEICSQVFGSSLEELDQDEMIELSVDRGGVFRVCRALQQSIHDIFGNHFGYFFLCLDATTEYELRQSILHSANTDFLTGLYNRRYFYEKMSDHKDEESVNIVYFDLDDFKAVNDTFGHQAGDQALIMMAGLLRRHFPGQLITRLGGDEFVVAHFEQCLVSELQEQVAQFIQDAGDAFHREPSFQLLSVSAGIACENNSDTNIDVMILRADQALYVAKSRGKAQHVLYGEF